MRTELSGELIVLEGPDGVGKTALAGGLVNAIRGDGIPCEYCSFPGRGEGSLGELIYRLHHRPQELGIRPPTATALQTLHVAAHLDAIEEEILPRLNEGTWIVLDRYWWSTWVYGLAQGVARESLAALREVEELQWGRVTPIVVFLVLRDEDRAPSGEKSGRERLKDLYVELLESETAEQRTAIIHNDRSIEAAVQSMAKLIGT